jgi:hypothetical protein
MNEISQNSAPIYPEYISPMWRGETWVMSNYAKEGQVYNHEFCTETVSIENSLNIRCNTLISLGNLQTHVLN